MSINIIDTEIDDLKIIEPKVFGDERGFFYESYSKAKYEGLPYMDKEFVQDNVSFSEKGVLRGLHYQWPNPQGKLVSVLQGEVLDVAVDIRRGSETFGKHVAVKLSAENKRQFWVPRGFAHGFVVLSDTAMFSYKCDDLYSPKDEHSVLWKDEDIEIDWLLSDIQTSEKDSLGKLLKNIERADLPLLELI